MSSSIDDVRVEVAKHEADRAKAALETTKIQLEQTKIRCSTITNTDTLVAIVVSVLIMCGFGTACYGCYRVTDLDKILAESGYRKDHNTGQIVPLHPENR